MNTTIRFWLFLLLGICSLGVQAQDVNEQTRRRQEIERQIQVIDKQIASNKTQQQVAMRELDLLQQKIDSRKLLVADIDVQIKQLNDSIKQKESEIKALQQEYERVEFSYLQMLYKAYTHRSRQMWVAHILASDNLRQGYRRWQYFKNFSRYINQQATQIKLAGEFLDKEINSLRKLRTDAENLKGAQQNELTTLSREERQSKQMKADLSRQEGKLRTQLQQKQREIDKINKEIAQILANAEKNRKSAAPKEIETDRQLAANFEQNKGKLPWPLNSGIITEPYGQRNHPVLKGIKMPFNNGVGIWGSKGDEVHAVFEGVVKQIVLLPGYNQCVLIQHGSYYTFYCKLSSIKVKTGDAVATGEVIGALSEMDGEYSLHFELWNGTAKQNPELWLRKR